MKRRPNRTLPWSPETKNLRAIAITLNEGDANDVLAASKELDDWRRNAVMRRHMGFMIRYGVNIGWEAEVELRKMTTEQLWEQLGQQMQFGDPVAVGYLSALIKEMTDIYTSRDEPG
jgi:hypothetical protein